VGFGIATPEQARLVAGLADGVIIGSAIVKAIAENPGLDRVESFVSELRKAI
jgi:tryptophan synthase alpha chain